MATAQAEVRRAPATASNGHAPRVRLHSEILPPDLGPATPAALRTSRRALAIMAVGIVIVQLISAPIGHRLDAIAHTGTDVYSLWEKYVTHPVPDILILGASPARTDVDEGILSGDLTALIGRPVRAETMGFPGENPLFLDALMYRIMKRTPHPKLIALTTIGPDLSENCFLCNVAVNPGLWDISDLTDPGFVQLALHVSPNPSWLAIGWALPVFAYYSSLIALQCVAYDAGRSVSTKVIGRIPRQLQNPTPCETLAAYKWGTQSTMTPGDFTGSLDTYRIGMLKYDVSPRIYSSVADMIARARAGGSKVVFLRPPLHPALLASFPGQVQTSKQSVDAIAGQLNLNVIDFSDAMPYDPNLWVDALHLDRQGAGVFAPQLAGALATALGS
ncbi:MAG TPA: hypothetical protein VFB69_04975 [Candidatus Dormibacteraeota bacterium]|nr:hypothetical protein [Candidatus Dormibacteraeota bacterium]